MESNKTECLLLISICKIKNAETENLKIIKKTETDQNYAETVRKSGNGDKNLGNGPEKRGNRLTN